MEKLSGDNEQLSRDKESLTMDLAKAVARADVVVASTPPGLLAGPAGPGAPVAATAKPVRRAQGRGDQQGGRDGAHAQSDGDCGAEAEADGHGERCAQERVGGAAEDRQGGSVSGAAEHGSRLHGCVVKRRAESGS